jgi:hypothetical protein
VRSAQPGVTTTPSSHLVGDEAADPAVAEVIHVDDGVVLVRVLLASGR